MNSEWCYNPGASVESLQLLLDKAPINFPQEYIEFLAHSNGSEGPIPVQPYYLCFDPIEVVLQSIASEYYATTFPGFVLIGGDGGGEFIAIDVRKQNARPIVALDMTNIQFAESIHVISDDFAALLTLFRHPKQPKSKHE